MICFLGLGHRANTAAQRPAGIGAAQPHVTTVKTTETTIATIVMKMFTIQAPIA
jgi:hypothetical protein